MKIAMVVPSLLNKAPVIVARDLAAGLLRIGVDVSVFYLDEKRELDFPCPVRKLDLLSWKQLQSFDVIHSHMLRPDLIVGLLRSIGFLRCPCVTTIHNIVEEDLGFGYGKVIGTVAAYFWRAAWVAFAARVVLTEHARHYYQEFQPNLAFTVINNGRSSVDIGVISTEDGAIVANLKSRYALLGSVAGVSVVKGLEQVVKALPLLPECAFLVIGDGPALPSLLELADELAVGDRVIALGYRPNARAYMQHMDCYLMPSRSEGMPLALIEAGLAARPIVCSDIPAHRDIFCQDEVAFFDLDSTESLASAIRMALLNRCHYGRAAFDRSQKNYSAETMVERYLVEYTRISKGGLLAGVDE
jgi:glycosyltransferase involved in cell wall biosynthesis